MAAEENDLRSTLESAFEEHENAEAGGSSTDTEKSVGAASEKTARESVTAAVEAQADRGDGRAPDGRFARKAGDKPADDAANGAAAGQPAEALKPEGEQQQTQADPYGKAPASWKPGAREAWMKLPSEVRAEVHRREREAATVLQETAQARQVHNYLSQLQQQYAPALQAENVDVLTASANLMRLSSQLRFGTPPEKAMLAAQIIRTYGVDVQALADALDGIPANPAAAQSQQQAMFRDPRVDTLFQQLSTMRAEREQQVQQQVQQKAVQEVEQFGTGKEFFEDVRDDMADILDLASKRGIDMTLDQAYERACTLHPEISKVLAARAAANGGAGNSQQSTQRAKIAASSVRGTPSGVSTANPDSLRATIEAAMDEVAGR